MSDKNTQREYIRNFLLSHSRGCTPEKIALKVLKLSAPQKLAANLLVQIIGEDERFEFRNNSWHLCESCFTPALSSRFVVVDIETTGGSPRTSRIIELSAFAIEKGIITSSISSLINPGMNIPGFISSMTGISNAHVKNAPPAEEALPPFMRFLDNSVFVAHNARFDWGFINMELSRCGMELMANDMLCTLRLTRRIFPGESSYGLDNLIKKFNIQIKPEDRHRGEGDAWAAAEILLHCIEKLNNADISSIEQMIRFQALPVIESRKLVP